VGIGALFGLYDYKYEVLGLLLHALQLEKDCGVGPHTISITRLEPAFNAPAAIAPPRPVSDADFKKLVAILRMAVPYTGMILSTRENPALRSEVFAYGVSQISAGSRSTTMICTALRGQPTRTVASAMLGTSSSRASTSAGSIQKTCRRATSL